MFYVRQTVTGRQKSTCIYLTVIVVKAINNIIVDFIHLVEQFFVILLLTKSWQVKLLTIQQNDAQ